MFKLIISMERLNDFVCYSTRGALFDSSAEKMRMVKVGIKVIYLPKKLMSFRTWEKSKEKILSNTHIAIKKFILVFSDVTDARIVRFAR